MSDPTPRQELVDFLRAQNAPHIREEFLNPRLEWHVVIPDDAAAKRGCEPDFRLKNDEISVPCMFSQCTIGTNGRNPITGKVSFIGGDIDADNHAAGLDIAAIDRIINKLKLVPWLQVNRSRSGKGVHFYMFPAHDIFADDNRGLYPLGRGLIERIAEEIEEPDLSTMVDKCGSIMFMSSPGGKFELLSSAKHLFVEKLEPFYPSPANREVETVDLDEDHDQLVKWLAGNARKDFARDEVFFHAHTSDLKTGHAALKLRGEFETTATGGGDNRFNCWLKPLENGAWLVGSWGDSEKDWIESHRGYRYTILNPMVTLAEFCDARGIVVGEKGYCLSVDEAAEFCREMGQDFTPLDVDYVMVKESPGQIRLEADITKSAKIEHPWRRASKLKAFYTIATKKTESKRDLTAIVRVAYSEGGKGLSFFRKLHGRYWLNTTIDDVVTKLATLGLDREACAKFVTTDTPYEIVNQPFKGETLSKYKWNRGAVQLAFPVAKEAGPYRHWQLILDHCGKGLNGAVANDDWCAQNGIKTGADYLMLWQARLFRAPLERLPALSFISSDQNCGKSTFFWSTGMLMTRGGYVLAAKALTTGFESLLLGAVLCDLDDIDLSQRDGAIYQKMQSLLTNNEMALEGKGANVIQVRNSTHWGHSANRMEHCPITNGDTRFVVVEVNPLEHEIPAAEFERALATEAPHYLKALFDLPMPEAAGRLFLPVLNTPLKLQLMALRAGSQLTDEQTAWLKKLKQLADRGKLNEMTTFEELTALMGDNAPKTSRALSGAWPKLATMLQQDKYEVGDRQNSGGKRPAAWYVRKAA